MIAPGAPGKPPKWTSSAKSGIGKSINSSSDVSFTIGHGTINEVFFPREDIACIRDIKCIVTNGRDFFSEEKCDTHHFIEWMEEGVPAFRMVNTCKKKRYTIQSEVITDPIRNTLLQKTRFRPCANYQPSDFHFYLLLTPHIHNQGMGNDGWKGDFKGITMLFARRGNISLALACSSGFMKTSVGYIGYSDGYTDLQDHKRMTWEYTEARDGNIAMVAELDISKNIDLLVAVGFGNTPDEAGNNARASILDGFALASAKYIFEWQRWQRSLSNVKSGRNRLGLGFRKSAAVLRTHESLKFPGGIIASLSIPWGESKGDGDLGGYHLVWPRDLALSSGGFLELDAKDDVLRILNYVMATQEEDGRWCQNMWLEGLSYFGGIQMDEVALPVLLVHTAYEKNFVDKERSRRYWPVVKKALAYLILNGPYTQQDRWEEQSGFTAFTIATEIAALVAGAALADANGESEIAEYCLETADYWNANIENWLYVDSTVISEEVGVEGYYIRINPFNLNANDVKNRHIQLKNHQNNEGDMLIGEVVSVDALALVRFGLRDANDPKILNTIKVIDEKLKIDTPTGPCWHRYNNDGYGEDAEGNPYSGHGIGRAWPLLTGERAHYEIAAGNLQKAKALLVTMESFANNSLLPEQIWDTADIPEKELFFGRPSGSAMPLTWAHAEYIKLCSSIKNKRIVDLPELTCNRYIKRKNISPFKVWRFDSQLNSMKPEKILRIELLENSLIRWTDNNWESIYQTDCKDTGMKLFIANLAPQKKSNEIKFTIFWKDAGSWEKKDFEVSII